MGRITLLKLSAWENFYVFRYAEYENLYEQIIKNMLGGGRGGLLKQYSFPVLFGVCCDFEIFSTTILHRSVTSRIVFRNVEQLSLKKPSQVPFEVHIKE